jgi:hypothetical protein
MLAVPLVMVPIAFAGGLYLVSLVTGGTARRAVDILGGAAAATVALKLFLVVRIATVDDYASFGRAESAAEHLADALWMGGLLFGLAAALHLLAGPRGLVRD